MTAASPPLNIIVMGTGPFAVPSFAALLKSHHRILALVTRPDRPAHRREKSPANPMRETAQQHGITVFEPESINSPEAHTWLQNWQTDLFVVCDYGQILSQQTLSFARLGGINLHASLLPKYRGAAPINWAIYHGETETGVTVIHMTPQLDAGPALIQLSTPIQPSETAPELESRLATQGVNAVLQAIEILASGAATRAATQDPKLATKAPRLRKEDGQVDWSRSATAIFNQVRAFQPWPKTYTIWNRPNAEPLRLILEKVNVGEIIAPLNNHSPSPGTILATQPDQFLIACGQGVLQIEQVQPAGKRPMAAAEFLRGHPLKPGDSFG